MITIRRFDKYLRLPLGIYPLFELLDSLYPFSRLDRQITLKSETLPVESRSHQRHQYRRRAHQWNHRQMFPLGNRHHIGPRVGHSRATGLRNHACRISLPQRFEKSRHLRRLRVTVQFIKRQVVDTNIGIRFFEKPSGRTHILYDKVTYPGYYFAVIRR